ncbi:WecB/TagA/CpsF family glycosyltransferase [Paenibacillus sp. ATY16]|nr:WecB/TagA/CpsF family glycosyltransferase [Paenibacillus sp. ATY16]
MIVNTRITALSFDESIKEIDNWINNKENHYVCICNTHSIVTASNDLNFARVLDEASMCTPDGMPLVWALKMLGFREQDRVDGPNLMLKLCEIAPKKNYKIYLYGGTDQTLEQLNKVLTKKNSGISIVGKYSPPFRKLSPDENLQVINQINHADADLIFVSLGCPKQEIWMNENRAKINGVMIGVGAAFDFIVGNIKRPPLFFQKLGLEWAFRLVKEPKRLWKRYAYNNPLYVYRFLKTFKVNKKNVLIIPKGAVEREY